MSNNKQIAIEFVNSKYPDTYSFAAQFNDWYIFLHSNNNITLDIKVIDGKIVEEFLNET